MDAEPVELIEARALLGKFEAEMRKPEAIGYLTKALSLLADVCADAASENVGQIASNLAVAYAGKVQKEVEAPLSSELSVHWETLEHWNNLFAAFEQFGFTLPSEVAETHSKIQISQAEKVIDSLSPSERKQLLQELQAINS